MIDPNELARREGARLAQDAAAARAGLVDIPRHERDAYVRRNAPALAAAIKELGAQLTHLSCGLGQMSDDDGFAAAQAGIVGALESAITAVRAAKPREF